MYKKIILNIFLFLLFTNVALAHQPRIINQNFVEVKNPEISQAFYGELFGEPALYKINSSKPFLLYVGLLVPDISNIDKDISAEISREIGEKKELVYSLDGLNYVWTNYYEEFAGDNYFKGPEFKDLNNGSNIPKGIEVESGIYTIKIYSPDNLGKYVFVVGEKEKFPLKEILNTFKVLPELKSDFFEKSIWSSFSNRIGLFFAVFLLIIFIILTLLIFIIKKIKNYGNK